MNMKMIINISILSIMGLVSLLILIYIGRILIKRCGLNCKLKSDQYEKIDNIKFNIWKRIQGTIMVIAGVVWLMAFIGTLGWAMSILALILNNIELEKFYRNVFILNGKIINIIFLLFVALIAFLDKKAKVIASDIGIDWPSIFEKKWWIK